MDWNSFLGHWDTYKDDLSIVAGIVAASAAVVGTIVSIVAIRHSKIKKAEALIRLSNSPGRDSIGGDQVRGTVIQGDHVEGNQVKGDQAITHGDYVEGDKHVHVHQGSAKTEAESPATPLPGRKISIAHLPNTGAAILFGRDDELEKLDAAWEGDTRVFALEAEGGAGKTALVLEWLNRLSKEKWRGAEMVFAWSFYSQGTSEQRASADQFVGAAMDFFGVTGYEQRSPWDKGRLLADAVKARRSLLMLDGMEPLQHPLTFAQPGRIKDPTLAALIKELSADNPGLCVITTRAPVQDLEGRLHVAVLLDHLREDDGAKLLASLGVKGLEDDLKAASREVDGHALALTLLGSYLAEAHGGAIEKRSEVHPIANKTAGAHARRVMQTYVSWLESDSVEVAVLSLLGLFDREARGEWIKELLRTPPIPGLTDALTGIAPDRWTQALTRLRRLRLLAEKDRDDPDALDAHPLVREYFGHRLKSENEAAWQEAHGRLYEYLRDSAEELPDTKEGLEPLYQAMRHGCEAGRHQETLEEVYNARIVRRVEHFSTSKLGLFGEDLAAIAGMFALPWMQPEADLTEEAQGFVLNQAGFRLRALGRLDEAVAPMRARIALAERARDWMNAALNASNLSELLLVTGSVGDAVTEGRRSVAFADRGDDKFWQRVSRTSLADALLQAGDIEAAEALFKDAETRQKENQPAHPILYSLAGYRYCNLLLGMGSAETVRDRATRTLEWVRAQNWLLDIALDTTTLGRAATALGDLPEAKARLDEAVELLRQSNNEDDIPRGLLARAAYWRTVGAETEARRDLEEVLDSSTRMGMRLFETDARLEYARLLRDSDPDAAREHLAKAAKLVEDTGYHRRDGEVEELQAVLGTS